jgi:NAD(P)-dependent dehydrogenase (short-subunit alcohol dehydrogenase family)
LVREGWNVIATVRRPVDGDRLRSEDPAHIEPVIMDVRDRPGIAHAAEVVTTYLGGRGLDGLVNVAGVGIEGPIEYTSPDDLLEIFDINVFGQIAVIQSFLPLIRQAKGRIVNISSVGAHIAIPFGGLLSASKGAFGLLSDTLRLELHPFGIHVATVEPAAIKTPAADKTLGHVEEDIAKLPSRGAAVYGGMMREFARRASAREQSGSTPGVVANAVYHALTAKRPRIRYPVGAHSRLMTTLPRILPDAVLDVLRLKMFGLPVKFGAVELAERPPVSGSGPTRGVTKPSSKPYVSSRPVG